MKFSEKIDLLMQQNHIKNLRQLANILEIPYTTLWDYYSKNTGIENAKLVTIKRMATKLHCSIDYLAYDEVTDTSSNVTKVTEAAKAPYRKQIIAENDYSVELRLPKPWEQLSQEERRHITEESMDLFYELKKQSKE